MLGENHIEQTRAVCLDHEEKDLFNWYGPDCQSDHCICWVCPDAVSNKKRVPWYREKNSNLPVSTNIAALQFRTYCDQGGDFQELDSCEKGPIRNSYQESWWNSPCQMTVETVRSRSSKFPVWQRTQASNRTPYWQRRKEWQNPAGS